MPLISIPSATANGRQFLETLAAAGAASLVRSSGVFGQGRAVKLNVRGGAIDVHHHFVPPPGGTTNRPWSPHMSLEQMDQFGIGVAILSMAQNGELLYNGTEKVMTVHSGGTVPMLAGRMNDRIPRGAEQYLPNGLYAELRKWYYDVAHATFKWPYAAMKAFMPESQILFGTDYAPEPIESTVDQLPGLKLPRAFEQMMLRGNAERLFPRFKVVP